MTDVNEELEEEFCEDEDDSLAFALSQQMRSAPWYMGSVGFHIVVFIILMLIPPPSSRSEKPKINIVTEMLKEEVPEFEDPPNVDIVQDDNKLEAEVDTEVQVETNVEIVTTELEISTEIEMDNNSEEPPSEDAALGEISDTPAPSFMGVGVGGGGGGSGGFGFRAGGNDKKRALARGGGDKGTEASVNLALEWLAAHQEEDGSWDPAKYGGGKWKHGITSLALLAFLGGGNSTRFGRYRDNVQRAVNWLMSEQKENGMIGSHRYECGIALMAMAESYGMSGDSSIRSSAQAIADYCAKTQSSSGGWEYTPNPTNSDSSVTGWYVMGLKSARVAEIYIDSEVYEKALQNFIHGTSASGGCYYKKGGASPSDIAPGNSKVLGAVSLTCMQFLGQPREDAKVIACAELASNNPPNSGHVDYYYIYYQALGLFQMGTRSHYWNVFNGPMKDTLLGVQVKDGTVEQLKGSFPFEVDKHGTQFSRVGTTAIAALTLQVYYRYHELHK